MGIKLRVIHKTQAQFEELPNTDKHDKALYFVAIGDNNGIIYQYNEADDSFTIYGNPTTNTIHLDGGRADEVYQQNDTIDGGGA